MVVVVVIVVFSLVFIAATSIALPLPAVAAAAAVDAVLIFTVLLLRHIGLLGCLQLPLHQDFRTNAVVPALIR